ncbi:hypothetical protein DFJ73DRAFT_493364 [Zopfochytrium polystomum]|nr:hypothetical protein DFJ73DRAFT_493364 [Zopfochytrium polystomum]
MDAPAGVGGAKSSSPNLAENARVLEMTSQPEMWEPVLATPFLRAALNAQSSTPKDDLLLINSSAAFPVSPPEAHPLMSPPRILLDGEDLGDLSRLAQAADEKILSCQSRVYALTLGRHTPVVGRAGELEDFLIDFSVDNYYEAQEGGEIERDDPEEEEVALSSTATDRDDYYAQSSRQDPAQDALGYHKQERKASHPSFTVPRSGTSSLARDPEHKPLSQLVVSTNFGSLVIGSPPDGSTRLPFLPGADIENEDRNGRPRSQTFSPWKVNTSPSSFLLSRGLSNGEAPSILRSDRCIQSPPASTTTSRSNSVASSRASSIPLSPAALGPVQTRLTASRLSGDVDSFFNELDSILAEEGPSLGDLGSLSPHTTAAEHLNLIKSDNGQNGSPSPARTGKKASAWSAGVFTTATAMTAANHPVGVSAPSFPAERSSDRSFERPYALNALAKAVAATKRATSRFNLDITRFRTRERSTAVVEEEAEMHSPVLPYTSPTEPLRATRTTIHPQNRSAVNTPEESGESISSTFPSLEPPFNAANVGDGGRPRRVSDLLDSTIAVAGVESAVNLPRSRSVPMRTATDKPKWLGDSSDSEGREQPLPVGQSGGHCSEASLPPLADATLSLEMRRAVLGEWVSMGSIRSDGHAPEAKLFEADSGYGSLIQQGGLTARSPPLQPAEAVKKLFSFASGHIQARGTAVGKPA